MKKLWSSTSGHSWFTHGLRSAISSAHVMTALNELEHTPWACVHPRSFGRVQMRFPNATNVMSVGSTWPRGQGECRQARRLSEDRGGMHYYRPLYDRPADLRSQIEAGRPAWQPYPPPVTPLWGFLIESARVGPRSRRGMLSIIIEPLKNNPVPLGASQIQTHKPPRRYVAVV